MNKYVVEIRGTINYDMMPRVKGAKLLCQGFIEDYEVEIDLDDIVIKMKGAYSSGEKTK